MNSTVPLYETFMKTLHVKVQVLDVLEMRKPIEGISLSSLFDSIIMGLDMFSELQL